MFEKITAFGNNFFGSLSDKKGSHSLTKWTAVAVGGVYVITSLRFTDHDNLVTALGVHAALLTSLLLTHKYYKNKTNNANTDGQGNNTPTP